MTLKLTQFNFKDVCQLFLNKAGKKYSNHVATVNVYSVTLSEKKAKYDIGNVIIIL